ncbi:hypothetical protein MMMDOFMJ_0159 [Methylobacterium gnaphalii]|nr:hypothetical protein MMMDOFMJ_0159 [Methylobacterium gnaphalii]
MLRDHRSARKTVRCKRREVNSAAGIISYDRCIDLLLRIRPIIDGRWIAAYRDSVSNLRLPVLQFEYFNVNVFENCLINSECNNVDDVATFIFDVSEPWFRLRRLTDHRN